MSKWTLEINEDGILTFPPDLLEITGWKEGDTLLWTDNNDGSWSLTKKETDNAEKKES